MGIASSSKLGEGWSCEDEVPDGPATCGTSLVICLLLASAQSDGCVPRRQFLGDFHYLFRIFFWNYLIMSELFVYLYCVIFTVRESIDFEQGQECDGTIAEYIRPAVRTVRSLLRVRRIAQVRSENQAAAATHENASNLASTSGASRQP